MPDTMFIVGALRYDCAQYARSADHPPRWRAALWPAKAATSARWSERPPPSAAIRCTAALASTFAPGDAGSTNGDRYPVAAATVSIGGRQPKSAPSSTILPERGWSGNAARWRPSVVRRWESSSAPIDSSREIAFSIACDTGGSGARPRNSSTGSSAVMRRTCRHSSSSGVRLSSGAWNSSSAAEREREYRW